jgi:hypothetical protein
MDGQAGRTNSATRVLKEVLRHFIDGDHAAWEDLLLIVALTLWSHCKIQFYRSYSLFLESW